MPTGGGRMGIFDVLDVIEAILLLIGILLLLWHVGAEFLVGWPSCFGDFD